MRSPRVVIGAPLYGQSAQLGAALHSLLEQTFEDFALVLVDDCSPDDTVDVVRAIAGDDPRVELHVNPARLGMLRNTNRAWELSRERHPGAEYWALGSDHDLWAPTWMARLVAALDARPQAVLAYPLTQRIDVGGAVLRESFRFSTEGMSDPAARLRRALGRMVSGDMIYGLFRSAALDRTGLYRPVLAPDRLVLSELALEGEFVQIPEVLWRRRFTGLASLARQRRAFWPEGAPARTHVPWWMTHTAEFAHRHGAVAAARDYVPASLVFQGRSRALRATSATVAPAVKAALRNETVRRAARERLLPAIRETRGVLERLADEAEEPR